MTLDTVLPVVLSVVAMTASIFLIGYRVRLNGLHSNARRRYLFMDMLIFLACAEMLVDSLADGVLPNDDPIRFVATLIRGMVTAGIIALVVSFPNYRRDANHHRRYDDA